MGSIKFVVLTVVSVALVTSAYGGSYRVNPNALAVEDGYLNMRSGPGQGHDIITSIPAGASVQLGSCVNPDDGISAFKWCKVGWNGSVGWVSSGGLEAGEAQLSDRVDRLSDRMNNIEAGQEQIIGKLGGR